MHDYEVRKLIRDLKRDRPEYMAEAKQRADKEENDGVLVYCPMCSTKLSILHVFPQSTPYPDPIIGTERHVKCKNCKYEALVTMEKEFTPEEYDAYPPP